MDRENEWRLNMHRYRLLWPKNPPKAEVDEAWYEIMAGYSYTEVDVAMTRLAKVKQFAPSLQELSEAAGSVAGEMRPKHNRPQLAEGYPDKPTDYGKAWLEFLPVLTHALQKGVVGREYCDNLHAIQGKQLADRNGRADSAMVDYVEAERGKLLAKLVEVGAIQEVVPV